MKPSTKNKKMAALKRKKVVIAIAEGNTLQAAGELAGYKKETAAQAAYRVMARPDMKLLFRSLLDEVIPDERLAAKYDQLLEATKVISANVVNTGADGMADANSVTRDFIEVPDYPTQLKSADSISKLKGHLVESNNTQINIDFSRLTDRQLREVAEGRLPKELE